MSQEAQLQEVVTLAGKKMAEYNDARALQGVHNSEWVKSHFTHRQPAESRTALHQTIVTKALDGIYPASAGQRPKAILVCGPFAVGKDYLVEHLPQNPRSIKILFDSVSRFTRGALKIDFAAMREQIPEYQKALAEKNPDASSIARGELYGLAEALTHTAKTNGYPIFDIQSYSDPSALTAIKDFAKTHDITIIGITAAPETIHERNTNRGQKTGRIIPEKQIDASIQGFSAVFSDFRKCATNVLLVDNDCEPKILYYATNGTVEWCDTDAYAKFLKRGEPKKSTADQARYR